MIAKRLIVISVLSVAAWLMIAAHAAFAQPALGTPDPAVFVSALKAHNWPLLVPPLCGLASWALKRFAPQGHFFHTGVGTFLMAGISATITATASAVAAKGLTLDALVLVIFAVASSLLASSNPSVAPGTTPPMAMRKPQAGSIDWSALLIVAMLAATMSMVVVAACTPAQDAAWKDLGTAIGKACLMPGGGATFVDLAAAAAKPGDSIESAAVGVAEKDGIAAAVCVAEQFLAHLESLAKAERTPETARGAQIAQFIVGHRLELPAKIAAARAAKAAAK